MPTPEFNPDDAITHIAPNYSVVDPVMYIVGKMRELWDATRTDGKVPTIDFAEVQKVVQFHQGDHIVVYTTSVTTDPVTIAYGFQNEEHNFTLDFFTSSDRIHAAKVVEETRRVLHSLREDTFGLRNDLPGRHWLQWGVRENSFDRNTKGFYRRAIDCILHVRFRQIKT